MASRNICKHWVLPPVLAVFITASVLVGVYLPGVIDDEMNQGVRDYVVLQPNGAQASYDRFLNNTQRGATPGYVRFWFFNITNVGDVRKGAKPNLTELGPYTYRAYYENFDVWANWSGEMYYKGFSQYVFDPELSPGVSENDTIFTLNLPFIGVLVELRASYRYFSWLLGRIAKWIEEWGEGKTVGLFMERSVKELLWGYRDPLLYHLTDFAKIDPYFSLMKNESRSDAEMGNETIMNTGLHNLSLLGNFEKYKGYTNVSCWNNHMEVVRGTDGSRFHPWIRDHEVLTVWVNELFRAINLLPNVTVEMDGVKLRRYVLNPTLAAPDPRFFQYINGLMNVTSPMAGHPDGPPGKPGCPVYFSLPHYCHADPMLAEGVIGLKCNMTKHNLHIDVEPITGQTWRAAKRLMMSSEFGPDFRAIDAHVAHTYLPIFWLEEAGQASEAQADELKASIYHAQDMIEKSKTLPFLVAALLGTALLYILGTSVISCFRLEASSLIWDPSVWHRHFRDQDAEGGLAVPLVDEVGRSGVDPYVRSRREIATNAFLSSGKLPTE